MVAHLGLLAVVAVQAPTLVTPRGVAGPPEPIIPILIAPRSPPKTPGGPPGDPIRLHRRLLRPAGARVDVPPLVTEHPQPKAEPKAPGAEPRETIEADLRSAQVAALWRARLGCGDPDAFNLTRDEREACEQQLAAAARAAPPTGLALPSDKTILYDRAAAQADLQRREREAPMAVGATPPSKSTLQPWKPR
ncbi:hypothetical protein [Phenylobacterium immobile]|uniref:hypothetical protein n=1 Tax=Phenylobacterium immobile TaxID=21 RepID=UPI000B8753F4|nr:hypothetical protein [Phenylobacterium immobile]